MPLDLEARVVRKTSWRILPFVMLLYFVSFLDRVNVGFPARYRAAAIAAFMAAAPLSTAIGSPVSGAIMELPTFAGLENWQWLYILEALPAILLGFVVLKVLTDSPEKATWLEPEERDWLVAILEVEGKNSHSRAGHTVGAWRALRDPRVLVLAAIYLGTSAGLYALGLWSPLILGQFSFSPLEIGWMNALPGVLAIVGMIAWARHSDRTLERTWHVVLPCVAACLGFLWVGGASTAIAVILALVIASVGINAAKPPLWAMPTMFLSGASAAAGIALINSIGNLGGFIGPYAIGWMKDKWGSYAGGLDVVGATLAVSAVLTLVLSHQLSRRRAVPPGDREISRNIDA